MTLDLATARTRLTEGYYNAQSKTVANPGGMGADGHKENLPDALQAVGLVGTAAAASESTATADAATATAAAGTASTQAGIATTQAGIATTKAAEAAASAAAAAGAVNGLKVSSDDSTPGHLETKLLPGAGLVASTQNPGGAETRTFAVDPDLVLASPTVSTLLTVSAGMQSGVLYLGDVSGDVVIEASDPLHIYCTIVGDTTFLVAGGTVPGTSHDHLIHWTMGGAGGYAVTILPLAQNTYSRDYQSTAEAGGTRPWVGGGTALTLNAGLGPDGQTNLTKIVCDAVNSGHIRQFTLSGYTPNQTSCLAIELKDDGDGLNVALAIHDAGATANYVFVGINPATGAIVQGPLNGGAGSGASVQVLPLANGCWLAVLTGKPNVSGTDTFCKVQLMSGTTQTFLGTGADGVLVGNMNLYPGTFAGIQTVGATRAGQVYWQGTPTTFPAIAAAGFGDLAISIEPDGRIVVQDHTVEEL